MYNMDKIIKIAVMSLIAVIGLMIFANYSFMYCLVFMLMANVVLQVAYDYTVSSKRPITFTLIFVLYICLAGYSYEYASKYINGQGIIKILEQESTSSILFLSCIIIVLANMTELMGIIKKNTYLWLPSNYIFIFIVFIVINISDWVAVSVKRLSYFIIMIGIIVLCFFRNEVRILDEIEYDIPFKSYTKYSVGVFIIILLALVTLPMPEYLPGAELLQSMGQSHTGDVSSSVKLNRNPSISDETLFKVYADEPLYLRSIAYSHYEDGVWKIEDGVESDTPLIDNDFLDEFDILYSLGDAKKKSAYIMEYGEYKNYLTINGIKEISPNEYISIVGDKNNICFKEEYYEQSIAYTVEYYDKESNFYKYQEAEENSSDRNSWLGYLEDRNLLGTRYLLSDSEYNRLEQTYTQIPKELYEPFKELARKITKGSSGHIEKAEYIEQYLKNDGGYRYELGAKKKDKMADNIYDFLFNGKKGICQDFASGMTLLCRSIGIPARYVTGYYSDEMNEDEDYVVRSKHAHAFVEVYISGYGWMLFDPTPPGSIGVNVGNNSGSEVGDKDNLVQDQDNKESRGEYNFTSMIIIVILITIAIWGVKIIKEIIWKKKLLKSSTNEAILEMYNGLIRIIESNNIEIEDVKNTTKLTADMLRLGIDISPISQPFEAYYYANKKPSRSEINTALEGYNQLRKHRTWKNLR